MKWPLEYVPLSEATKPKDGECLTNRWWVYKPDEGILFVKVAKVNYSPQCNSNKIITEGIRDKLYPGHDIRYVEVVYLGHRSPRRE